jgi:hypothetical protein
MVNDVIWIVTDEPPTVLTPDGSRDGQGTGNPYENTPQPSRSGIPIKAEKLEQGMAEFLRVMGNVLENAQQSAGKLADMELDEIELSVEVNGEGQLSLLGSGAKAGAKGAMKLKFKASKSG